jgi:hypothetical protein
MAGWRLSIASSMVMVLLLATGIAALTKPSALWADALFTLTLGLLCTATSLSLTLRGLRRAFWIGFAVFGWPYFGFGVLWSGLNPEPTLLSRVLLAGLHPHGQAFGRFAESQEQYYMPVGQCLATIVFALVGATLVRFVAARDDQSRS